jgi:O-antigen ligase
MCLLRNAKFLWFLGLVLLAISSLLTGSRTPLAVVGVSGLMLLAINALRSRRLLVWFAGAILAAAMVVGAVFAITWSSPRELSTVTEGRWDLWTVAAHRFSERPLLGNGYLASEDDPTYIPGGYHSEYLTAFAEQGIVGFAAVLYLLWFLLRCCWSLAFRHSYTWHNGQWALFGCFFLLVRASVEVPGLFGYAQEPADFLAYAFLAIIVSRFSREEDYLRSATSLSPVVSASDRGIRTGRQPSMRTPTRNRRLLANLHEVPLS